MIYLSLNGREYKHGYYICNGMYPHYAIFMKAYLLPRDKKQRDLQKKKKKIKVC